MENEAVTPMFVVPEVSSNMLPSPVRRRGGGLMRLGTRRARAACALCRWKKVRCDAEDGQPCSNCNFEDVQCVLIQKQRRKKTTRAPKPYLPPMTTKENLNTTHIDISVEQTHLKSITHDRQLSKAQTEHQCSPPPTSIDLFHVTKDAVSEQDRPEIDMDVVSAQSMPPSIVSPTESLTFSSIERSLTRPSTPYLRSPSQHVGHDDIEYLHRKGALSPPACHLRDALIQAYILFNHPTLPILDLRAFLASIENPSQHGQISLPLFQAIMFAGSAWVDIKLLRELGFLTRKAARKSFYQKARLLYDADYEEDRLCLVQTLVLLTLWWESFDEQKDGWYWSGLSLHVSRTIGLNREPAGLNVDHSMQRLRRRLWWSCVLRDTLASFGTQRPPSVKDHDFDVAMLTIDDFDLGEPTSEMTKWTTARSTAQPRQLATIFIEQVKLCRIISKILDAAFPEDPVGHIGTFYRKREFEDKVPGTPSRKKVDTRKLALCEDELSNWREEVPEEALHAHSTASPTDAAEQAPILHRAMLSLLYFTALLSVHRPLAARNTNCSKIRYAALQCNEIFMDLYRADLMRLMPATAISCLLPVAISHIHDMRSADDRIRQEAQRQLEECKQVLRELSDAHRAAEWAINFLTFVESQVKRKARRKMTGMMSGEITWDLETVPLPLPPFTAPFESNLRTSNDHAVEAPDLNSGATHVDRSTSTNRATPPVHGSDDHSMWQTSAPEQSPDDFSSMINFPEMWLDMAGAPDSMLDMDWINGN